MIFVLLWYLMLAIVVSVSNGNRRVIGGRPVTTDHPYMVYLRKAERDPRGYTGWLCGGALVGSKTILTSAACVEDVQYLYVIAGYDKYVADDDTEDSCIKHTIKKVVNICVPKAYDLIYGELDKWANYDIAVVEVNAPIIGDPKYKKYCSYEPRKIEINYYNKRLQNTNQEALILGWGHKKVWRKQNDTRNLNVRELKYASTNIYDKDKCIKDYKSFGIDLIISKYMICTLTPGLFDDQGEDFYPSNKTRQGCDENLEENKQVLKEKKVSKEKTSEDSVEQDEKEENAVPIEDMKPAKVTKIRRAMDKFIAVKNRDAVSIVCDGTLRHENIKNIEKVVVDEEPSTSDVDDGGRAPLSQSACDHGQCNLVETSGNSERRRHSKRTTSSKEKYEEKVVAEAGICQNDHGGPLVAWIGSKSKVIGVASVFQVYNNECHGPYLFTSTYCSSKFLRCVVDGMEAVSGRRSMPDYCYLPPKEKGFEIIERRITWRSEAKDSYESSSSGEKYLVRPQKPLQ